MIEPYSIEPERLRCRYCGAKAAATQEICLQCGRLLRTATTHWFQSAVFGLVALMLLVIVFANWRLGGDENRLRRGIVGALARLDQLAAEYDPRLVATMTASLAQSTEPAIVAADNGITNTDGSLASLPNGETPVAIAVVISNTPQALVDQGITVTPEITLNATPVASATLSALPTSTPAPSATAAPLLFITPTAESTIPVIPTSATTQTATAIVDAAIAVAPEPTNTEVASVAQIVGLPTATPLPRVRSNGAISTTAVTDNGRQRSATSSATMTASPTPSAVPTQTPLPTAIPTLSPTPLPTPTEAAAYTSYVIQQGDTPVGIANRYRISVEALLAANGLTLNDATRLRLGQTLLIPIASVSLTAEPTPTFTLTPAPVYYTIQAGDTPVLIARKYGISVDQLMAANGLTRSDATRLRVGQSLIIPGAQSVAAVETATFTATPLATPLATPAPVQTVAIETATAAPIPAQPTRTVRLEAPRLRNPENGNKLGCDGGNRLIWDAVPAMLTSDRYRLHLGYVSAIDANGAERVTWVLQQEISASDPSWRMDPAYCGLAPQEFNRRWQWYVEVIDPTLGGITVSPPSAIWSFIWE